MTEQEVREKTHATRNLTKYIKLLRKNELEYDKADMIKRIIEKEEDFFSDTLKDMCKYLGRKCKLDELKVPDIPKKYIDKYSFNIGIDSDETFSFIFDFYRQLKHNMPKSEITKQYVIIAIPLMYSCIINLRIAKKYFEDMLS